MKRIVLACAALPLSGQMLADDCTNTNTQIEMNTRVAEQYKAVDAEPNETYQNALKRAAPTQRDLLKKVQISWITLRDANCALISSGTEGGSVQAMISSQCLTGKTDKREAFLASLLQYEEGSLSCPLPPTS